MSHFVLTALCGQEEADGACALAAGAAVMRAQVSVDGVSFVPYRRRRGYGIVIHDERWIRRTMEQREHESLRLVRFAPRGWDAHQDVWSFERVGAHA